MVNVIITIRCYLWSTILLPEQLFKLKKDFTSHFGRQLDSFHIIMICTVLGHGNFTTKQLLKALEAPERFCCSALLAGTAGGFVSWKSLNISLTSFISLSPSGSKAIKASLSFLDISFWGTVLGGGWGGLLVDTGGSTDWGWADSVEGGNTLLWNGFTALDGCAHEADVTCAGCAQAPGDWETAGPKDAGWLQLGTAWVPKASGWVNPAGWVDIIDPGKTDAAWLKADVCVLHGDEVMGKPPVRGI